MSPTPDIDPEARRVEEDPERRPEQLEDDLPELPDHPVPVYPSPTMPLPMPAPADPLVDLDEPER
jgi:hypothetical protein